MIRFNRDELNEILLDFLGKDHVPGSMGPDTYDCSSLVYAFAKRIGIELPIPVDVPAEERLAAVHEFQNQFIKLDMPRAWSVVTFVSPVKFQPHIGIVLPEDGNFLHCPSREPAKVCVEPLRRKPWSKQIDGYWWPKDVLEVVLLVSPLNVKKKAWQFVRIEGRNIAEIVREFILDDETIPIHTYLSGTEIEVAEWANVVPTDADQLVIRPEFGDGDQAAMTIGMLAIAMLAPALVGSMPGMIAGTASYNIAVAAVTMAGGLAMNALVGPDEAEKGDSQAYGWNPATTQKVGALQPLVYGRFGIRGNMMCSYADAELTTDSDTLRFEGGGTVIKKARDAYYLKIGFSEGPVEGFDKSTVLLSGRRLSELEEGSITVEHFRGTNTQVASEITDRFEIPVGIAIGAANSSPVVKDFWAVQCDDVAVVLYFPNGFTDWSPEGDNWVGVAYPKIEIRVYGEDDWFTLFNAALAGSSKLPVRLLFSFSGIGYDNYYDSLLQPYNIEPGVHYEVRVDRDNGITEDRGTLFRFEALQMNYFNPQRHPGKAYTTIGAVANEDLNGSIDFYGVLYGMIIQTYDGSSGDSGELKWSDNPAWVAYNLLTRPKISGHGAAVAAEGELTIRESPDGGVATITIDTTTYRFSNTPSQINDIKRVNNRVLTQQYLVNTINGTGVAGVDYYAGTTSPHPTVQISDFDGNDQAVLTAVTAGAAGNSIVTTDTFHHTGRNFFDDSTLGTYTLGFDAESYAIEYYRGLDPSQIDLEDFQSFADWCDELVSISSDSGDTEKRYRFDGQIDQDGTCWDYAVKVCKSAWGSLWWSGGNMVRLTYDKPGTPTQVLNASNLQDGGFTETWIDTGEAATSCDIEIADCLSDYGREIFPVMLRDSDRKNTITVDGFGHTRRTQAWRYCSRLLKINDNLKRVAELPGTLDSIYIEPGEIAYVQHPALQLSEGGRITAVLSNTITVDKEVAMSGESDALLIRTHDGAQERQTLYSVVSVTGAGSNVITISGSFAYTPSVNDLWTFGETTKVTDLYRIKGFERSMDGDVTIQGAQYSTSYYDDDEEVPRIESQEFTETKGSQDASLVPLNAEQIASRLSPVDIPVTDTIVWEGVTFEGDGIDTVTWSVDSGGGIRYQGAWAPIESDAVGTTDKFIYFDPDTDTSGATPLVLKTTNDLSVLAGSELYLFCINENGVAFDQAAIRVSKNGAVISIDDMPISGMGANTYDETFEDPFGDFEERWRNDQSQTMVLVSGGVTGGQFLRVGDNSGNDEARVVCLKSLPFDPTALYQIKARVRQTSGTGLTSISISGRNATDTAYVAYDGSSDNYGCHHIALVETLVSSAWVVYTGYFKGTAAEGDNTAHNDPDDPAVLHEDVRYIRPAFSCNLTDETGQFDIDEIAIVIVPEVAAWSGVYGAAKPEDYADVTSVHAALKTSIYTFDCNDGDSTDDYQFDDTAEDTTEQIITVTDAIPAYAELVSLQLRCFETVTGSATMTIDIGTSSGGDELLTAAATDTADDLNVTAAAAGSVLAATNAARDVYLNATPGVNWSTLSAGRWALMLNYIDYGYIYSDANP